MKSTKTDLVFCRGATAHGGISGRGTEPRDLPELAHVGAEQLCAFAYLKAHGHADGGNVADLFA